MRNYYILKVASGSEHQVVEYLKKLMSNSFLGKYIFNPVVPEVTTEKKDQREKKRV